MRFFLLHTKRLARDVILVTMAAGGRNPQKSAVARARNMAKAKADDAGGGGNEGVKGRQYK